jgi:hypothetical protein
VPDPKYDPIVIDFNQRPQSVLQSLDEMMAKRTASLETVKRYRRLPLLVGLGSLPFACLDGIALAAGYPICVFSLVSVAGLGAAAAAQIYLNRRKIGELSPQYQSAYRIIHALRDDVNPKRPLFGKLDLTGPQQPSKVARESKDALGRTVQYFRDDWLSLRMKLFDGNMLRLAVEQRSKVRAGYWGRGRVSGKSKWKAPKFKGTYHEMRVRLTVNPALYEITLDPRFRVNQQVEGFIIERIETTGGIIDILAAFGSTFSEQAMLNFLKTMYTSLLKVKAQA